MSKKKLLIDNYAFVKSKSTLTESEDKKGDYIIEGEFGMVDAKNANNRIYPKEIMEREAAKLSREIAYKNEQQRLQVLDEAQLHFDIGNQ